MFKKLKDKLTEEVKIPSQKFTQSMQQLAQAVVSPGSSNNSSYDAASNDNFSIDGDFDDTPQSSPAKQNPAEGGIAYRGGQATPLGSSFDSGSGAGFTHVDLQQDASLSKTPSAAVSAFSDAMSSLRSSVSSLTSDSSFMFPVLESSGPTYNFQSDLESCSEASESVGPNINKEQLVLAYQKIHQKYNKYKGRYTDLARHYRDLERDNKNAKHILTECQDKALRRMAELKEQCNLEKQAKAHLEEALRSDLEEKDHLIHTLKTKIKLLRNQVDHIQGPGQNDDKSTVVSNASSELSIEPVLRANKQEDLLSSGDSGPTAAVLTPEPANVESENALKEKLKRLESLLHKCKEDITNKRETIKQFETDKHNASAKIEALQQQLITIQKREEEASLSLAKNKQTIHRELEAKEDEIKKLKSQLAAMTSRVSELQSEITQVKDDSKKDLAAGKIEAAKLLNAKMEELLTQNKNLEACLATRDHECNALEERSVEMQNRLKEFEAELIPLRKSKEDLEEKFNSESKILKEKLSKLQNCVKAVSEKGGSIPVDKLKPILNSVQELHQAHSKLKGDMSTMQKENLAFVDQQNKFIVEKVKAFSAQFVGDHENVLSELEEYKREAFNARESLSTVSSKFVLLEQTLSSEKAGVESKMTDLEKELISANKQIKVLEERLKSETSSHQSVQEELSKKLLLLEEELNVERNNSTEILKSSSSAEHQLSSEVEDLKSSIKRLQMENLKKTEDYQNMKEKADSIQTNVNLLQNELETLQRSKDDAEKDLESVKNTLEEKNECINKLENTISELNASLQKNESELQSSKAAKAELELKLTNLEADLMAQITDIKSKYQEADDLLKDIEKKKLNESDATDTKIMEMLKEIDEKEKEITNLQTIVKDHENEIGRTAARNNELKTELEEADRKVREQELSILSLQDTNNELLQSLQQLQSTVNEKADHITLLENACAGLEKTLAEKCEQSGDLAKFKEELLVKSEECNTLTHRLEELNNSQAEIKENLQQKVQECNSLAHEMESLRTNQSEQSKIIQQKSEGYAKLEAEIERLTADMSHLNCCLDEKVKECEDLQSKLFALEKDQTDGKEDLSVKREECARLMAELTSKSAETELMDSQLKSLKQEYLDQSTVLEKKVGECDELKAKLQVLTAENTKIASVLQQKTMECEEKEAQLDSLADEMKRVEELSQELHRINDDRDANVEVLSSEASSLAQKVEELTATTQELKEREVDLLEKLQAAQDLEAQFILIKQREEALLSKLNEAKAVEMELKTQKEDLQKKSEQMEEENAKLKEIGQSLPEIISRAKEAESKCEKLQNDGADLLLRIQRAEESELECSQLKEELEALKKENAGMLEEMKVLQSRAVFKGNTSEARSSSPDGVRNPVEEELCVVKKFADLTEDQQTLNEERDAALLQVKEWEEKYNKLVAQHKKVLQENAETVERLKEENLLSLASNNAKQKERLWDRQDNMASLPDGNSNGSFGTIEKLQQQLSAVTTQLKESKKQHRQEVDDLRRILLSHGSSNSHPSSRSDNLEDATELEYLRNILYEYMMGKEPMILARVIAAVVKFDSEQTSKVLQKEQQRLSLLGHLGIS